MHKDIFAAPIRGDEAKTLVGVVPLHRPNLLNCGPIGRGMVCGSLWSGTPRLLLRRGARIHAEDLRHLRPLRPGPARTSSVAPGGTLPWPPRSTTLTWRNAS